MRNHKFHGLDHVRTFMLDLWQNLDTNMLISVYHEWIERLEYVIAMNGD
jgi:hypothetical protein